MSDDATRCSVSLLARQAAEARLGDLADVLADAVNGGASVGLMLPFGRDDATAY